MPADIDQRIASKTANRVPVKREKAEKRNTKLDWAMSRNYQFIPYKRNVGISEGNGTAGVGGKKIVSANRNAAVHP